MFVVILVGIVALAGIVAIAYGARFAGSVDRGRVIGGGVVALIVAGIILLAGSITTVGANQVGVVTEFGRYQGTAGSGISLMAPWADIEEFGTRVQPLEMPETPIRFDGNSGGSANLLAEWRIEASDPAAIERLWRDYRTFDAIQNRVVESNTRNALNVVLAGYTPSDGVDGTNLTTITEATLADIQAKLVGTGVVVERVTIRQINPDDGSQTRINQQVQAAADRDRALIEQETARTQADTAAIRQQSQTPSSLQFECLRIVADWDQGRQGQIPATFDCALNGAGDPVIVGR